MNADIVTPSNWPTLPPALRLFLADTTGPDHEQHPKRLRKEGLDCKIDDMPWEHLS